jgi:hypothetical protein
MCLSFFFPVLRSVSVMAGLTCWTVRSSAQQAVNVNLTTCEQRNLDSHNTKRSNDQAPLHAETPSVSQGSKRPRQVVGLSIRERLLPLNEALEPESSSAKKGRKHGRRSRGGRRTASERAASVPSIFEHTRWQPARHLVEHLLQYNPDTPPLFPSFPVDTLAVSKEELQKADPATLALIRSAVPMERPDPFSIASEAKDPHAWFCLASIVIAPPDAQFYSLGFNTWADTKEMGLEECYRAILRGLLRTTETDYTPLVKLYCEKVEYLRKQRKKQKNATRPRLPRPLPSELVVCPSDTPGLRLLALPDRPDTPCAFQAGDAAEPRYLKAVSLPSHGGSVIFLDYEDNIVLMHCAECKTALYQPNSAASVPVRRWFGYVQRRLLCPTCLMKWENRLAITAADDTEAITKMHLTDIRCDRPQPVPRPKLIQADKADPVLHNE